jgi:CheY-like chemotaxis protein
LPKISGIELLQKLYAARMALPVIMATGTVPEEASARCPWFQPAAVLLKPYTAEELLTTVKNALCATDSPSDRIDLLPDWPSPPPTQGSPL